MKKHTLLFLFVFAFKFSKSQQIEAAMTNYFDSLVSMQFKPDAPGATVIVLKKGEIIYKKAFGLANVELNVPMEVDNVFRIASVTKQFTAMAILKLAEQGKLGLNDNIKKFIPDFPSGQKEITIEHLLTHTSGIVDYSSIKDTTQRGLLDLKPLQVINLFKNLPLKFEPGSKWEYSNSGYFLLGYIIEVTTGKPYSKFMEETFFKPLGMDNTFYANDIRIIKKRANGYTYGRSGFENAAYMSMSQPYAAGAIQSTVEDLSKWHAAVIGNKLVSKELLAKAFAKYTLSDGSETAYGYGWRVGTVYNSNSLWHGGLINGFMSWTMYLPKEEVFVAVLSNCDCNSPEVVASKIAALAAGRPEAYNEFILDGKALRDYAGVYENKKGQQRIITLSEGKVFSQLGRWPKSLIKAHARDNFFYNDDALSSIEFTRNKNGNVEKLTTIGMRGVDDWIKTNKPIPDENGIQVAEKILDSYVGHYVVSPNFSFSITKGSGKIFLQATGQEKLELFAETKSVFFLKVNDAVLEFITDASGKVEKVNMKQGGRVTEAKKVK